ncbi:MAG: diguanylate cyclase [Acidimicrobiia bacterium]
MAGRADRWKWCLAAWVALGLLVAGLSLAGAGSMDHIRGLLGLAAAIVVALGIRRRRPHSPRAWWLLAAAVAANALGDLLTSVGGDAGPVTWIGTVAYLAAYPLCLASLWSLLGQDARKRDAAVLIDGVVAAMALWSIVWLTVAWPALEGSSVGVAAWLPTVLYPPLDVLLLMVLARLGRGDQRTNRTWRLLMTGLAAMTLADLVATSTLVPGVEWLDRLGAVGFVVAFVAIGAAAIVPDFASFRRDPQPDWRMVHPHLRFVALGIALGVPSVLMVTTADSTAEVRVLVAVQLLMIAAVVFRAWLTVDVATAANDRLGWRATHDPLTGLLNRDAFIVELESARHRVVRGMTSASLLFLDLDGFKAVNDHLGHEAGDEILVEVARRIEAVLRRSDAAARFGGDEFVVLCEDRPGTDNGVVAAVRLGESLGDPYVAGGQVVLLGASIGCTDAFVDALDADDLLRRADLEMYRVKTQRRRPKGAVDGEMESGSPTRPQPPRSLAS